MIGAALRRVEDARFLTGQARYVGDLVLPGMLHVAFLRSPHAHARITHLDMARAGRTSRVALCLDGETLARHVRPLRAPSVLKSYRPTGFPALALGTVRYVGEAVAAVVADTRYAAEDALELIDVAYEPLPVVADPEVALAASSPLVHAEIGSNVLLSRDFAQGDVETAMSDAAIVVSER